MQHNLLVLVSCALAAPAVAQNFNYVDFSNPAGLVFNGNAATSGTVLRVTPGAATQIGSAWYSQPIDVAGGFDTTFVFKLSQLGGGGGDGFAFVIQNDPRGTLALGEGGSAMGYGSDVNSPPGTAIANSLVIEFDTYQILSPWGDPDANHISIHTNGTGENNAFEYLSIGLASPTSNMSFGTRTIRIRYEASGNLWVYFDNLATPLFGASYSFATGGMWTTGSPVGGLNLIGGSSAYVGFTAATGSAFEAHDILSWSWTKGMPTTYCTPGVSGHGCTPTISGTAQPSVSFAQPCSITVNGVEGQRNGILFYGLTQLIQPWASGSTSFLCVKPPTQRAGSQNSGGTSGQCNGSLSLDWNAFQQANPGSLGNPWTPGRDVYCQGWYRDPPAPKTTHLSDALWLTYVP